MALEHTARGAARAARPGRGPPPSAKKAHATDRFSGGELCGEVLPPAWGATPLRGVEQNEAREARSSAAHGTEWRCNTTRVAPPDA